jgi:hypothetical protein
VGVGGGTHLGGRPTRGPAPLPCRCRRTAQGKQGVRSLVGTNVPCTWHDTGVSLQGEAACNCGGRGVRVSGDRSGGQPSVLKKSGNTHSEAGVELEQAAHLTACPRRVWVRIQISGASGGASGGAGGSGGGWERRRRSRRRRRRRRRRRGKPLQKKLPSAPQPRASTPRPHPCSQPPLSTVPPTESRCLALGPLPCPPRAPRTSSGWLARTGPSHWWQWDHLQQHQPT